MLRYEELIAVIYSALYNSFSWPNLAIRLQRLEAGNATAALNAAAAEWSFDPTPLPQPTKAKAPWDRATNTTSEELGTMVICGDAYDAPQKDLDWYQVSIRGSRDSKMAFTDSWFASLAGSVEQHD